MNSSQALDLTLENFQQVILEDSKERIIVVQFWAPWSEPCQEMSGILQQICGQYAEQLTWVRVNCDEQAQIVQQFQVRGLPTVMLVKDGQPLDGFAGPQTHAQVLEVLQRHLPKPEDDLCEQAAVLIEQGDYLQAFGLAKQAFELDAARADICLLFADCCVETGKLEQAKTLIASVKLVDQDAHYHSIVGKIELAEQAAESPEIKALQEQLDADPENMELKLALAIQLHQSHQSEQALELLLTILRKDLNFADAKKVTLDMINALPDGDPLKSQFRRKIYSLLY